MPIRISGSTGISGLDGSATTPVLQGASANSGIYYSGNTVFVSTSGTNAMTIGPTGNVAFANSSVSIGGQTIAPSYGMKNKLINGAMQFAQRGSGVAVTGTTSYYALDRWFAVVNGGTTGAGSKMYQSTSAPTGFQYSLKFGRESGGTSTNNPTIGQVIESINCYDLQSQTVTLSFWAKAGANYSSSGSTLTYSIDTGTGTDQGSANIFGSWTGQAATQSTVTLTTSWQRFTVTATIGSTVTEAGVRFWYTPTGTAGADDYFYLTGVQLEVGSVATPFEFRHYTNELQLCQRYYARMNASSVSPSSPYSCLGVGVSYNSTYAAGCFSKLPVTMRATPTISFSNMRVFDGGSGTITSFASNYSTLDYWAGDVNVSGGLTTGRACILQANNTASAYLDATAEL